MFLGVDVGTSGVKAIIADERGGVVASASAPLAVSRPAPLWSEQDPGDWWSAACSATQALPAALRAQVSAIGLSGQMHGAVLLGDDDKPLRPAILWNDGRSSAACRELEEAEPRLRAITGNIAMPGFTAPKLLWVRRHEPDIFNATRSVLLPKDYVRLLMTGEKASDMSDAAGTLWLDVGSRHWSEELLAATGLSVSHMPRLVEGTALSGMLRPEAAEALGLPAGVPVAGGGGDNAASAVGMGAVNPGDAFLSIGTSGVIFVCDDAFRPNPGKAVHAFCHALPDRWHRMSVMLSAASALDWAARTAGFGEVGEAVAAAAAISATDAHIPVFLPYLTGERTPHNDSLASGVLFGLRPETTSAHVVRAAMEGVAFGFADGLAALSEAGAAPDVLTVVGGGARSRFWGEILAAALSIPLAYRSGADVGAALGAARLAMICAGANAVDVCRAPVIDMIIEPDARLAAGMSFRSQQFRALYPALSPAFQRSLP